MTEKKFRLVYSQLGSGMITDDKNESIIIDKEFQKVGLLQVVDLLNELVDENKQLKQQLKETVDHIEKLERD